MGDRLFVDRRRALGLLLAGCALMGCAMHPRPYTINRFALDHDCPRGDVEVQALGSQRHRATGCGQQAVYLADCGLGYCNLTRERTARGPADQATTP